MVELKLAKELLDSGKWDEAVEMLKAFIAQNPHSDEAYFILGNAYRKREDWQSALNNYQIAMDLNEESPAYLAYQATTEILEFYNKDMFNQ